jgi:hypothetical protein
MKAEAGDLSGLRWVMGMPGCRVEPGTAPRGFHLAQSCVGLARSPLHPCLGCEPPSPVILSREAKDLLVRAMVRVSGGSD